MFDFWPVYSGERFRASWPSCLSSPEPNAPVGAYSIGRLCRPLSNYFPSETTWPIHIEPREVGGKKKYSNDVGHMTNMAAMPIYGKNLKKSSSPEPID